MKDIFLASIYLSYNENIEHLSDFNLTNLKRKVFIYLKDYICTWYPELLDKIKLSKTIESLLEEDDEIYMERLNYLIRYIKEHEEVKISFFSVNSSSKEIHQNLDLIL